MTDPDEPTQPDHERPTDPSPPPSTSWPPKLGETVGLRALDRHPAPTIEPFRGSLHVNEAGEVVQGPFVPARDWLDYGKDTGPRLRIASMDALPDTQHAPPDPNGPDPGDIREAHQAYKRAQAEDDDHAIAKLFPDVLDELHSKNPGERAIPELNWSELEPAMAAEWREWGQAHAVRGRMVLFRKTPDVCACEAIVPLDTGDPYLIKSEERAVRQAWKRALGDPRRAASLLVRGATEELHKVRRSELAAEHHT